MIAPLPNEDYKEQEMKDEFQATQLVSGPG